MRPLLRVIAPQARRRVSGSTRGRAMLRAAGLSLGLALFLGQAMAVGAASPSPSRVVSTDTRSALEGPGFVGAPGLAIALVVALGLAALIVTLAYVRLTGTERRRPVDREPPGESSDRSG
jgi:hypothetical protein